MEWKRRGRSKFPKSTMNEASLCVSFPLQACHECFARRGEFELKDHLFGVNSIWKQRANDFNVAVRFPDQAVQPLNQGTQSEQLGYHGWPFAGHSRKTGRWSHC